MNYSEWSIKNEFNPFNSLKILKHVDYWKQIVLGKQVPPPIAVTVDPANACNYSCIGCNAQKVMADNKGQLVTEGFMNELPGFLAEWKVRAVTLAGGGEPLISPYLEEFLLRSIGQEQYELALITNGYFLDRYLVPISLSTKWVGVSIDASNEKTYQKIKNTEEGSFTKVIKNVTTLCKMHKKVSYKFLINKYNIDDIYDAARLAKEIGCCAIHIRPMGTTWYDDDRRPIFSAEDVDKALTSIGEARATFEDGNFRIFGVTHKFDKNWKAANCFDKCWASFMYLVIEPNGVISTCCDNRGNPVMQLATGLKHPHEILLHWGSEKHFRMLDEIEVSKCPRCTFALHNQLYERCILNDDMDVNFI